MKHTKVFIIGSGPAGYSAAIYAARAGLDPVLAMGLEPGGQLMITTDVENYPGYAEVVQGPWMMEQMQQQTQKLGTVMLAKSVTNVHFDQHPFILEMGEEHYTADAVIIATGAKAKWLGLSSEKEFMGHGVSACATCDGFFFKNQKVMVVGGGNTAVEEAIFLSNHAQEVVLVPRRDSLRAENILQQRLFSNKKISVLWDHSLVEILGTQNPKQVSGVQLENTKTHKITKHSVDGVFVAIGHAPQTNLFKDKINMDTHGYITVTPGSTRTNIPGVFAAGDVQDKVYRQAITAAGQGCMAALDAQKYLQM